MTLALCLFFVVPNSTFARQSVSDGGATQKAAQKIVSLDYCADQFVLKLAAPARIAAVSNDAKRDFSYMRDAAEGHRQIRPSAEQVLALAPDLIVRSYGGGSNAEQFYRRIGIPVIQIGFANTIDRVQSELLRIAQGLGGVAEAQALILDMDRRLMKLQRQSLEQNLKDSSKQGVLYVTPGGVTSGPGSLVHELITAAGLKNFQTEPGWRALPLEELVYRQPDLLATAFYHSEINYIYFWSAARHPMIRNQLSETRAVTLDSATTACGGWFLVDAIEQLAAGATQ